MVPLNNCTCWHIQTLTRVYNEIELQRERERESLNLKGACKTFLYGGQLLTYCLHHLSYLHRLCYSHALCMKQSGHKQGRVI